MKKKEFWKLNAGMMLAGFVFLCGGNSNGQTVISSSPFSARAEALGFQDWISVKHTGPEDKPLQEFIVAFTTATAGVSDEAIGGAPFKIITLPKIEMNPLLAFIHKKGSTQAKASRKYGAFRVLIYSASAPTERLYMGGRQSRAFFQHIESVLKGHPVGKSNRRGTDTMIKRLSRVED